MSSISCESLDFFWPSEHRKIDKQKVWEEKYLLSRGRKKSGKAGHPSYFAKNTTDLRKTQHFSCRPKCGPPSEIPYKVTGEDTNNMQNNNYYYWLYPQKRKKHNCFKRLGIRLKCYKMDSRSTLSSITFYELVNQLVYFYYFVLDILHINDWRNQFWLVLVENNLWRGWRTTVQY